jgi:hypothetical protein
MATASSLSDYLTCEYCRAERWPKRKERVKYPDRQMNLLCRS